MKRAPKRPLTLHRETLLQISEDRLGRDVRAALERPIPPPRTVGGSAGAQCCQI